MKFTGYGQAIYMMSPPANSDSNAYLRTLNCVEHWESIGKYSIRLHLQERALKQQHLRDP